jgi:hypothetical protein
MHVWCIYPLSELGDKFIRGGGVIHDLKSPEVVAIWWKLNVLWAKLLAHLPVSPSPDNIINAKHTNYNAIYGIGSLTIEVLKKMRINQFFQSLYYPKANKDGVHAWWKSYFVTKYIYIKTVVVGLCTVVVSCFAQDVRTCHKQLYMSPYLCGWKINSKTRNAVALTHAWIWSTGTWSRLRALPTGTTGP